MICYLKKTILGEKSGLISSIIAGIIAGVILLEIVVPQTIKADFPNTAPILDLNNLKNNEDITVFKPVKKLKMIITAYSSTPEETDESPFITASGSEVRDGIVANNMLPFGTKIRMPELYGDKVFIVEDRMHQRKGQYQLDVWFPEQPEAKKFGAKLTYVEILEN